MVKLMHSHWQSYLTRSRKITVNIYSISKLQYITLITYHLAKEVCEILHGSWKYQKMKDRLSSQIAFTRVNELITTHLLVALGCSTITRMCFLGGFDDKKQERKAQNYV